MNAKNAVSETTATTGGAGVGQVITLTGAENAYNPTFAQAYGGAQTDIPVSVQAGNDWQTCRCDFDGSVSLTVKSIQSQFAGGVYDDTSPTGITLTGTPVAQVSFNAASLVDSFGGVFQAFAGFDAWVDNAGTDPTVNFSTGNNQIVSNATVGAITLVPAPSDVHGTVRVDNPDTITTISAPGVVTWVGNAPPTWSTTGNPDYLSVVWDGDDCLIGVSLDCGNDPLTTEWLSPTLGENIVVGGDVWTSVNQIYASDDSNASSTKGGNLRTDVLRATGFDTSSIPDVATIIGIEATIERQAIGAGDAVDDTVNLWNTSETAGDDKASATPWVQNTDTINTFGGLDDTWNAGLTGADVNKSTFGFQVRAYYNAATQLLVDHMQMRIRYRPN